MDTTTSPLTTAQRYEGADRPLSTLLDSLSPEQWDAPSPCEGWDARAVVRHLIETQRDFLFSRGLELGEVPDIDGDPAGAWRAHRAVVLSMISEEAVVTTTYDGHFGPTSVGDTLERFYVFDMVVHRWDVAGAAGAKCAFTDAELDQLEAGIESFGDAIHMEGICKAGVEAPAGADRRTLVLATLGRRA
jgi:uncharacterized protein (TIGR03086 family)